MYFWKPELFVNRDLTKISTYLNFSQNSFALGSPYNFTIYTTAKIYKLNIIHLPLSKRLLICFSWCSAHTVFFFFLLCFKKHIRGGLLHLSHGLWNIRTAETVSVYKHSINVDVVLKTASAFSLLSVTSLHSSSVSSSHVGGMTSASTYSLNDSAVFNLQLISAKISAHITLSCHFAHFWAGSTAITTTWLDIY